MNVERYALCGIDIAVIRQDDGRPLVITSALARALGIPAGTRRTLDAEARLPCRLSRVRLDEGAQPCRVDAVPLDLLGRYADLLWRQRAAISHAAADRVWQFRHRLARIDKKNSNKSSTCGDGPVAFAENAPKTPPLRRTPLAAGSARKTREVAPLKPL